MNRLSYEDFKAFYEQYGRMPHQLQKPNNPLNERQLERGYKNYLRLIDKQEQRQKKLFDKQRKKEPTKDEKWQSVRHHVFLRDGNQCRLIEVLTPEEYKDLYRRAGKYVLTQLDPAHILSRSSYPSLKYDSDNIVVLNRYSHSLLDEFRHPIYGHPISQEEQQRWWIRIVGKKHIDTLKERGSNGKEKKN